MSTSLLYHAFGIRGYRYSGMKFHRGEILVRVKAARESLRCPCCGSSHVHVDDWFRRQWRTLPIGAKTVWIEMWVPKVECQACGAKRRVEVQFADPKRRHTRTRVELLLLCREVLIDQLLHGQTVWTRGRRSPAL